MWKKTGCFRPGGAVNIVGYFRKSRVSRKGILIAYVLAFIGAAYNHVMDILHYGWLYRNKQSGAPFLCNVYWTSLTLLDPLSIIVLLLNIRAGLVLFYLVMISDVLINFTVTVALDGFPALLNFFMISQFSFLVFLLLTGPFILKPLSTESGR